MIQVTEMDHIVLRVQDVDRSLAFYTDVIGLEPYRVEQWRSGKIRFPSVRLNPGTIIDLVKNENVGPEDTWNLDHFCFTVKNPDFQEVIDALSDHHVPIEEGPKTRSGARGDATSVYIRDPDNYRLELRRY